MNPLSRKQKSILCDLAGQAFAAQEKWGQVTVPTGVSRSRAVEAWRRVQQFEAVGIESLTACDQRHYAALVTKFSLLAGRSADAFKSALREDQPGQPTGEAEAVRQALWHLRRNCAAYGYDFPAWPLAVARDKFRATDLEQLSPKQLWQLIYTARTRGAAKRKKEVAA